MSHKGNCLEIELKDNSLTLLNTSSSSCINVNPQNTFGKTGWNFATAICKTARDKISPVHI